MNKLISEYLDDILISNHELKNKICILRRRGYSIDLTDERKIKLNYFAHEYDDVLKYIKLPVEQLIAELFSIDSVENYPVCCRDYSKWGDLFGNNTLYGEKVKIKCLEPFVARLIRALALCGIFTFYSCDGWHFQGSKNRKLVVLFSERYSQLWFKTLIENDEELKMIDLNYICEKCEFCINLNDENRINVYRRIDAMAEIFYRKRKYFQRCKTLLKQHIIGLPKSSLTDDELLKLFFDGYESVKSSAILDEKIRTKEQEDELWKGLSEDIILRFFKMGL